MLYEKLTDRGYYVVMASGTDKALSWAAEPATTNVDLIISDQRMPGEEGSSFLSFLSELKKSDPETLDKKSDVYRRVRGRFSNLSDEEFFGVIKYLKNHRCPHVILSGYAEDASIERARKEGSIDLFISKEQDLGEILEAIDGLLGK